MEKIIHFTVPEKLTAIQADTIERARVLHPAWDIRVWQDPVRPDGYSLEKYWPHANSGAQLSDLLRIDLIYRWGGVYVDSDMRLLKPLDELAERFDFFIASETGNSLEPALIGAVKGHPAIKAVIDELLSNEPDWRLAPDKTTGPDLFARVLRWNRSITVLPRETFYSYDANETHARKTHRHSYGEHLWDWSWKKLDRKKVTPRFSILWNSHFVRLAKRALKSILAALARSSTLSQIRFYGASGEIVVRAPNGILLITDGNDINLTPRLILDDFRDTRREKFLTRILHGGDWVIDIGAKFGSICMLAGQTVGSFGRVFAYEANPRLLKLLSKSVIMNWMHDRVIVRPASVGNVDGKIELSLSSRMLGVYFTSESAGLQDAARMIEPNDLITVETPCVLLDHEFPVDLPIKLLNIESAGLEAAVLSGARRLLKQRCIDFVLLTINPTMTGVQRSELLAQVQWLAESNYLICKISSNGSLVAEEEPDLTFDTQDTFVFVARDQHIFERLKV